MHRLKSVFHGKPHPLRPSENGAGHRTAKLTPCFPSSEVAVGEHQYIPLAPSYLDGTFFPGVFQSIGGGHVDLTDTFTDHDDYVSQITIHARDLQANGYLLEADADAIIQRASDSDIGGQ